MNEFFIWFGICASVIFFMGVWCVSSFLFKRWLNNDWCRHKWGAWENVEYERCIVQHRHCAKCNMMEKRTP